MNIGKQVNDVMIKIFGKIDYLQEKKIKRDLPIVSFSKNLKVY